MAYSVIFDMDGVLVDSEPVINAAAIMGLAEYGIHANPEDFTPFIGTGEDSYIGGVARKYGAEYKSEMKKRVYEIYLDIVGDRIKVFDGVHHLLETLSGMGTRIALASSADLIKIEANLKAAGINIYIFDVIVSGEDVERKKPFPDIYLYAAERLNVKPENCIVIEDALNGIRAAKAAEMKSVAVETSFSYNLLGKEKPDYICRDIPAVEQKLVNLFK